MDEWWLKEYEFTDPPYEYPSYYPDKNVQPVPAQCLPQAQRYLSPSPTLTLLLSPGQQSAPTCTITPTSKGDNPREIRNKAEKQRRDKLNQSISQLASMVPPVVKPGRKIDKTSVLRLTAHYLRSHQYVFGDSINRGKEFSAGFTQTLLSTLKGFLLTTTYKGIIVVVSPNVQNYLGYSELELLGQNIFNIVHHEDHRLLREQLLPMTCMLGSNGELIMPDGPNAKQRVSELLANDKRSFMIRFKKLSQQRSEPPQYLTCHVEGSLRKSDRACSRNSRYCHVVRRVRSRGENHFPSGNDIVFIGLVRPACETFISECMLESFRMEYRTRHTIDGEIIQCEQRIALVTGYMTHEVSGVNAMNFMHRDDVRWVVIALRQMYDQSQLFGESCYRLMTKNGRFIYMRTCGRLDVDESSKAVTSFVCTNTVVTEQEGKRLIKLMKKKFTLLLNSNQDSNSDDESVKDDETQVLPVEDPRRLEKVILHLVTNLPPPPSENSFVSPFNPTSRLTIIPPRRERIVCAIEKSYSVIKTLKESDKMTSNPIDYEKESIDQNVLSLLYASTIGSALNPLPDLTEYAWMLPVASSSTDAAPVEFVYEEPNIEALLTSHTSSSHTLPGHAKTCYSSVPSNVSSLTVENNTTNALPSPRGKSIKRNSKNKAENKKKLGTSTNKQKRAQKPKAPPKRAPKKSSKKVQGQKNQDSTASKSSRNKRLRKKSNADEEETSRKVTKTEKIPDHNNSEVLNIELDDSIDRMLTTGLRDSQRLELTVDPRFVDFLDMNTKSVN